MGEGVPDQALRAAAAADRLRRALGALSTRVSDALQPTAEALGWRLKLPEEAIATFSEEVRPLLLITICSMAP